MIVFNIYNVNAESKINYSTITPLGEWNNTNKYGATSTGSSGTAFSFGSTVSGKMTRLNFVMNFSTALKINTIYELRIRANTQDLTSNWVAGSDMGIAFGYDLSKYGEPSKEAINKSITYVECLSSGSKQCKQINIRFTITTLSKSIKELLFDYSRSYMTGVSNFKIDYIYLYEIGSYSGGSNPSKQYLNILDNQKGSNLYLKWFNNAPKQSNINEISKLPNLYTASEIFTENNTNMSWKPSNFVFRNLQDNNADTLVFNRDNDTFIIDHSNFRNFIKELSPGGAVSINLYDNSGNIVNKQMKYYEIDNNSSSFNMISESKNFKLFNVYAGHYTNSNGEITEEVNPPLHKIAVVQDIYFVPNVGKTEKFNSEYYVNKDNFYQIMLEQFTTTEINNFINNQNNFYWDLNNLGSQTSYYHKLFTNDRNNALLMHYMLDINDYIDSNNRSMFMINSNNCVMKINNDKEVRNCNGYVDILPVKLSNNNNNYDIQNYAVRFRIYSFITELSFGDTIEFDFTGNLANYFNNVNFTYEVKKIHWIPYNEEIFEELPDLPQNFNNLNEWLNNSLIPDINDSPIIDFIRDIPFLGGIIDIVISIIIILLTFICNLVDLITFLPYEIYLCLLIPIVVMLIKILVKVVK